MLIHNADITGSLLVNGTQFNTGSFSGSFTGIVAGTTATASYVEYNSVANKPALVSGSSQITYSGLTGIPSGIVSGSSQVAALGFASTGSSNTFQASQTITGSLFITQNLVVAGSSSIQYISSSVLDIADNIITVNAFNPGVRFGGLAVIDSGSSPQVSGSLLFDSIRDQWIFVHQNQSVVTSSVVLMGPETYNDLGNETYLSANRLPKGSGVEYLRDSNITDTGTVVSINSNTGITGSLGVTGSMNVLGGSVGIGTTSPSSKLSVDGDIRLQSSTAAAKSLIFSSPASNWGPQDSSLKFTPADGVDAATSFSVNLWDGLTNTFERMRITSGGQVLIGQTVANGATNGIYFRPGIESGFIVTSDVALQLSRLGTTGDIQTFYSGTTRIGKIAVGSSTITFESATNGGLSIASTGAATFSSSVRAGSWLTVPNNFGLEARNVADTAGRTVIKLNSSNQIEIGRDTDISAIILGTTTEQMRITSGGNVGIGTSTPLQTASNRTVTTINGTSSVILNLATGDTLRSYIYADSSGGTLEALGNLSLGTNGSFPLVAYTNGSERLRITTEGYLGITVTGDTVSAGDLLGVLSFVSKDASTYSSGGITNIRSYATTTYNTGNVSGDLRFYVSNGLQNTTGTYLFGTEAMRITSDGIVVLSNAIELNGTITNYGTGTGVYTRSTWYNDTSNQVLFENARQTDSPSGTGRTVYFTWRGGPSVGGGVQLQHGTNAWAAYTSDARLKTKVADISNGLEAILKLEPIKFKWTRELENSKTVTGFTAQNIEQAIPDAVFNSWQDEELGDVKSYYQDYLTPYLVKAIQELKTELDTAKAEIETLKQQ